MNPRDREFLESHGFEEKTEGLFTFRSLPLVEVRSEEGLLLSTPEWIINLNLAEDFSLQDILENHSRVMFGRGKMETFVSLEEYHEASRSLPLGQTVGPKNLWMKIAYGVLGGRPQRFKHLETGEEISITKENELEFKKLYSGERE